MDLNIQFAWTVHVASESNGVGVDMYQLGGDEHKQFASICLMPDVYKGRAPSGGTSLQGGVQAAAGAVLGAGCMVASLDQGATVHAAASAQLGWGCVHAQLGVCARA